MGIRKGAGRGWDMSPCAVSWHKLRGAFKQLFHVAASKKSRVPIHQDPGPLPPLDRMLSKPVSPVYTKSGLQVSVDGLEREDTGTGTSPLVFPNKCLPVWCALNMLSGFHCVKMKHSL